MSKLQIKGVGLLRRTLDELRPEVVQRIQEACLEASKPQLLDESTRPVRVLALPSQPVEITWLDTHGHVFKVETRTFEGAE